MLYLTSNSFHTVGIIFAKKQTTEQLLLCQPDSTSAPCRRLWRTVPSHNTANTKEFQMQIGEAQGFGEVRSAAVTTQATEQADNKKENEKISVAYKGGDTAQISAQGKTMAASAAAPTKAAAAEEAPKEDPLVKSVKDRIKQLQEEIQELQGSNTEEKEKQQKISMLNQELATQNATLQELQNKDSSDSRYGKGGLVF